MNEKITEIRLPAPSEESIKEAAEVFKFLYGEETERVELCTPYEIKITAIEARELSEPVALSPGYYTFGCSADSFYYRKHGEREIKVARLK